MLREKRPIPLPKDIHENGQTADADLDARDDGEYRLHPASDQPIVATECQAKRKDVLEHEQTGKGLDGDVSMRIDEIESARHGAEDHTYDLEGEEEIRPELGFCERTWN